MSSPPAFLGGPPLDLVKTRRPSLVTALDRFKVGFSLRACILRLALGEVEEDGLLAVVSFISGGRASISAAIKNYQESDWRNEPKLCGDMARRFHGSGQIVFAQDVGIDPFYIPLRETFLSLPDLSWLMKDGLPVYGGGDGVKTTRAIARVITEKLEALGPDL